MKKVLLLILIFVMSASVLAVFVSADEAEIITMDSYAKDMLSRYVKETRSDITYATISEPFILYDFVNNRIDSTLYFALSDDEVLGMLNVAQQDDGFNSLYYYDVEQTIGDAFTKSKAFAIGITNDGFLVILEDDDQTVVNTNIIEYSKLIDTEKELNLMSARSTIALLSRILDVTHVANTTINGKGVCWAACVAMNVNYVRGTSYTATDVYNTLLNQYNSTPVGNTEWIKKAYEQYGITPTVYDRGTHDPYTLTYTQIYRNLSSNKPIHIGLLRTGGGAHGIVIIGITAYYENILDDYYAYYYFRDPKTSSEVCLQVGYDVMLDGTNLEYYSPGASGTVLYDDWMRTVELTTIS